MNKRLLIEPLMSESDLRCLTSEEERCAAAGFPPARRREYLTWRVVVRRELGAVRFAYNAVGAPVVEGCPDVYIGVSHGAERVAVCISDSPCGVDIERPDRDFSRVASRYLSSDEAALSDDSRFPALVWSAKETLYKLSGEAGLDLLADLQVVAVGADWIEGRIKDRNILRLRFRYLDDAAVVVWYL